jgi:hypothetical protein
MRRVDREWFVGDDLEGGSCLVFGATLVTFARKCWERTASPMIVGGDSWPVPSGFSANRPA